MSKLQKILVRAKRQVFSELIGENPSIFKGEGYDFIEMREYQQGDDIRSIDWNVTAKMQRPYVKIFREERELNVVVASMLNGSTMFGESKSKQELIAEIVALTGFSVLHRGDILNHALFSDRLYSFEPPTKRLFAMQSYIEQVLNFKPLFKKANYKEMADMLFNRLRRKSLILVIADFFEIPNFQVLAKKHEVVAIIVRDRAEENPSNIGFRAFQDMESSKVLEGDFNRNSINGYRQKVIEHDKKLFETLTKDNIRFIKIYTDEFVAVKLRRLFERV